MPSFFPAAIFVRVLTAIDSAKTAVKGPWIAGVCRSASACESAICRGAIKDPVGGGILVTSTKRRRLADGCCFPSF
jgi:hypothetical protein